MRRRLVGVTAWLIALVFPALAQFGDTDLPISNRSLIVGTRAIVNAPTGAGGKLVDVQRSDGVSYFSVTPNGASSTPGSGGGAMLTVYHNIGGGSCSSNCALSVLPASGNGPPVLSWQATSMSFGSVNSNELYWSSDRINSSSMYAALRSSGAAGGQGFAQVAASYIGWSSGTSLNGGVTPDTTMTRGSAGTVQVNNVGTSGLGNLSSLNVNFTQAMGVLANGGN